MEPDIQVAGLAKTFRVPVREGGLRASLRSLVRRTTRDVVAVAGIDFTVQPGEVVGFLGPNGAGKTTTLRMLAGLIVPSSGTVQIDGEPMSAEASHLRGRIGFLTEAPGLWDRLTVYDNLVVYARLQGVTPARDVVNHALELFGNRRLGFARDHFHRLHQAHA